MSIAETVAQAVREQVERANALAEQISVATADKGKALADVLANSDDETVVKWREWVEKAEAKMLEQREAIEAYAKNLIADNTLDVEKAKEEYATLKKAALGGLKFLDTVPDVTDEVKASIPAVKNLRGGTSGGGGKRPRVELITVDGHECVDERKEKDGTVTRVSNFTLAAKYMSGVAKSKVEVKDLQAAAFSAAGTDDLSSIPGQVFDYYLEGGEGEHRHNFHVTVQTKESATEESSDSE